AIGDARMRLGVGDLSRAGIGGDDMRKAVGKMARGLPVARATIPGEIVVRAPIREPEEQIRMVARAAAGIRRGDAAEMILKTLAHAPPVHQRLLRSRRISRAALWPGAPVTPPPGWAPEAQR